MEDFNASVCQWVLMLQKTETCWLPSNNKIENQTVCYNLEMKRTLKISKKTNEVSDNCRIEYTFKKKGKSTKNINCNN